MAKIVGINTERVIGATVWIGSAMAGIAGILIGFDMGLDPRMGSVLILKGIIACLIGGVGNIYGAVIGSFLLGFTENFGIWAVSGEWKDTIAFAILIAFLLFRPKGILNR